VRAGSHSPIESQNRDTPGLDAGLTVRDIVGWVIIAFVVCGLGVCAFKVLLHPMSRMSLS
jgi:hypothetical protein